MIPQIYPCQRLIIHTCLPVLIVTVIWSDVASDWLACFPFTAQKHVYDVFFVDGLATEVVQTLIPRLHQSSSAGLDVNAIVSNIQRCE